MTNIISVSNLRKTFKTHSRGGGLTEAFKSVFARKYVYKHALKGISFDIKPGEIVGFIGPNGAGKSTCIKALSGVLHPDSGEVRCLGFTPWKERTRYVKNIGVVFGQKTQLWWDLPAIDTFILNQAIYDIPEKQYNKRLNCMLELLQVEDVAKTPVRNMSLGERMKCEVIASLLHNPKVVFFDEPTIGMDAIAKQRLRNFVRKINKEHNTTFILTTHNIDEIEDLCKRVIIINHGAIVYDGSFKAIKQKYIRSKTLDIKFESPVAALKLPRHAKVLERTKVSVRIAVNTDKQSVKAIIDHLLKNFEVADITISDPPIDTIISEIYAKEGA